jgi:hypothetical protein
MDPELVTEQQEEDDAILSLDEIAEMKRSRLAVLAAEITAQRERIYAEYEWHKTTIVTEADLDESRAVADAKNSLRLELYALDESHNERLQGMDDFYREQRASIEKTSSQLLAVAKSQKTQRILEQSTSQNFSHLNNINVKIPFNIGPIPAVLADDENNYNIQQ